MDLSREDRGQGTLKDALEILQAAPAHPLSVGGDRAVPQARTNEEGGRTTETTLGVAGRRPQPRVSRREPERRGGPQRREHGGGAADMESRRRFIHKIDYAAAADSATGTAHNPILCSVCDIIISPGLKNNNEIGANFRSDLAKIVGFDTSFFSIVRLPSVMVFLPYILSTVFLFARRFLNIKCTDYGSQ